MRIHHTHTPGQPSGNQPETLSREQILESTKQMLGGLSPYLCFGVAQQEALLKATLVGATPDHDRSVRMATRHVESVDPDTEATAVVHAGMMFVAALKAGVHPADAGVCASEAVSVLFGVEETPKEPDDEEPDMDY